MTLIDPSFAIRSAALLEYEAHEGASHESRLLALKAQIHELSEKHDADVLEARTMAANTERSIQVELAHEVQDQFRPLFQEFSAAPSRVIGAEIRDAFKVLNDLSLEQLGAPLSFHGIGIALGSIHGMAERMGHREFWQFSGLNPAPVAIFAMYETITAGASGVIVEGRIIEAERAISARGTLDHLEPARLAVILSRATETAIRIALAEYDYPDRGTDGYVAPGAGGRVIEDDDADGARAISRYRTAHQAFLP